MWLTKPFKDLFHGGDLTEICLILSQPRSVQMTFAFLYRIDMLSS